jgi:hypothetical protein
MLQLFMIILINLIKLIVSFHFNHLYREKIENSKKKLHKCKSVIC